VNGCSAPFIIGAYGAMIKHSDIFMIKRLSLHNTYASVQETLTGINILFVENNCSRFLLLLVCQPCRVIFASARKSRPPYKGIYNYCLTFVLFSAFVTAVFTQSFLFALENEIS
jgi:hypothetical protein